MSVPDIKNLGLAISVAVALGVAALVILTISVAVAVTVATAAETRICHQSYYILSGLKLTTYQQ